jgi:hypothetical protein
VNLVNQLLVIINCHSLNSNEEQVPHCIDTDDFDEDEEDVEKITKKDVICGTSSANSSYKAGD